VAFIHRFAPARISAEAHREAASIAGAERWGEVNAVAEVRAVDGDMVNSGVWPI